MAAKNKELKVEPKKIFINKVDTIRFRMRKVTLVGTDDVLKRILKVKN